MDYYETKISFTVLSERPIPNHWDVSDIAFECADGEMVMGVVDQSQKTINGKQMAKALTAAGSDPDFFSLDDKGNSVVP